MYNAYRLFVGTKTHCGRLDMNQRRKAHSQLLQRLIRV